MVQATRSSSFSSRWAVCRGSRVSCKLTQPVNYLSGICLSSYVCFCNTEVVLSDQTKYKTAWLATIVVLSYMLKQIGLGTNML